MITVQDSKAVILSSNILVNASVTTVGVKVVIAFDIEWIEGDRQIEVVVNEAVINVIFARFIHEDGQSGTWAPILTTVHPSCASTTWPTLMRRIYQDFLIMVMHTLGAVEEASLPDELAYTRMPWRVDHDLPVLVEPVDREGDGEFKNAIEQLAAMEKERDEVFSNDTLPFASTSLAEQLKAFIDTMADKIESVSSEIPPSLKGSQIQLAYQLLPFADIKPGRTSATWSLRRQEFCLPTMLRPSQSQQASFDDPTPSMSRAVLRDIGGNAQRMAGMVLL